MADEITISTDESEDAAVESAAEVVQAVEAAEAGALAEGMMLGQLAATVEALRTDIAELKADQEATEDLAVDAVQSVGELATVLVEAQEAEAEAEAVEAVAEAEAQEAEAEAEAVEAVAAAAAETQEDEDLTPASRRTHWFFRPGHEWRRD